MTQAILPIFPPGSNTVSRSVGFIEKDGVIYYFLGQFPIYSHAKDDISAFRFITAQLVVSGNAKQVEIINAFGVPPISVKRGVKTLREKGLEGFYQKGNKGGSPHVLTPKVAPKIQKHLNDGLTPGEIGRKLNINPSTIQKAIESGRLKKKQRKKCKE